MYSSTHARVLRHWPSCPFCAWRRLRFAATRNNDSDIYKRIVDKAKSLDIPLEKRNLKLERTTREMIITAKYEQTIDLKFTKYVFKFDQKERAPLF